MRRRPWSGKINALSLARKDTKLALIFTLCFTGNVVLTMSKINAGHGSDFYPNRDEKLNGVSNSSVI